MQRVALILYILIVFTIICPAAETVKKGEAASWIVKVEPEELKATEDSEGAVRYLLSDMQRHLEEKTSYTALSTEILNAAGAEDYSQLSVDFQPTYQALVWHTLEVERDGVQQNRLENAEFEVIRREQGLDRQLYDGELTAHVILKDIRPGDRVSYSYSIIGENPIFAGNEHFFTQLAFGVDVGRVHRRVLWDEKKRTLYWHVHDSDLAVTEKTLTDGLQCLVYDKTNSGKWDVEDMTPNWFQDYPFLEVSDYRDWEAFGKWALMIYAKEDTLPPAFKEVCDEIREKTLSPEEEIIEVLRWVQENIRYLGSFLGEHTHAPHPIAEIETRRFGDCKDKGMSTVAMLKYLGYDAAPALVNTSKIGTLEDYLPGHRNFDHLIVHLKHVGKDYWLDPTRTFQHGTLESQYSVDYQKAYVIRVGTENLASVEPTGFDELAINVREVFTVADESGDGTLTVTTVSTGLNADNMRRSIATNSRKQIEEDYRDYYEDDYPGLEVASPLEIVDNEVENRITTVEHYKLNEFLTLPEAGEEMATGAVYARAIGSYLVIPDTKKRNHPYWINHPVRYNQTIELTLPKAWEMEAEKFSFALPSASYSYKATTDGKQLTLEHKYESSTGHVDPEDFVEFSKAIKNADEKLYFSFNYPVDTETGDADFAETSTIANPVSSNDESLTKSRNLLGVFVTLGIFIGLAISIAAYFWDPPARTSTFPSPNGIGGWLILPTIGCFVNPFFSIYNITTYFDNIGAGGVDLFNAEADQSEWLIYYCTSIFSEGVQLVLSILLLVLLVKHRTSFPYAYIGFVVILLASLSLNYSLQSNVPSAEKTEGFVDAIVSTGLKLAIWVAYMLISERVKATFQTRRKKPSLEQPEPLPIPVN